MNSSSELPATIRRAQPEDIGAILDLLTEYGLPRSYFEPFYLNDASYRPEHSWVAEQHGRLVSHLRIFDRWIRVGWARLHIAGVGNVITAQDARGRGYAGQLMRAMLPELHQEGYAYSLLWTHLPDLYSRYGWVPIEQDLVRAVLSPSVLASVRVAPFQQEDLPAIMRLYETANAERTGTIIRTPEYWRQQPTWLHEGEGSVLSSAADIALREGQDSFLVAHDSTEEVPVGYVRSRVAQNAIEVLELGFEGDSFDVGRTLLALISVRRDGQLQGQFPPSLRDMFLPGEFGVIPDPGLMGRVINLTELTHALESLWHDRVREGGVRDGSVCLSTSAGRVVVQLTNANVQINMRSVDETAPSLNESEFAHLLFHGFDERADKFIGDRPESSFLQALFPRQDFVIWQADAF